MQVEINVQSTELTRRRRLLAGIAAILLGAVAIAMGPGAERSQGAAKGVGLAKQEPTSESAEDPIPIAFSGASQARVKSKCRECGVIESMRRIAPAGPFPEIYEITVRMGDGSTWILNDASPANWRTGERMNLIAGKTGVQE